jgi:hypothetical protein
MAKWMWMLLAVAAGCGGSRPGYVRVEPVVDPAGRPMAILPLRPGSVEGVPFAELDRDRQKEAWANGIKLAEWTAKALRERVPGLRVLGPDRMRGVLRGGFQAGRLAAIGREVGAKLLVVGEIRYIDLHYSRELQMRDGRLGLRLSILEVTGLKTETLKHVQGDLVFPEEPEDRYETRYVLMKKDAFRNELLRFAAEWVAKLFYEHEERIRLDRNREVTLPDLRR